MFRSFFFLLDEVKVVWFYTIQFEAGCSFPILWVSPRNRDARRNLNEFFPFGLLFNRGRSRGETFSNNFHPLFPLLGGEASSSQTLKSIISQRVGYL